MYERPICGTRFPRIFTLRTMATAAMALRIAGQRWTVETKQMKKSPTQGVKTMQFPTQLVLFRCWLFVSCEGGKKNRSVSVWSSCTAYPGRGSIRDPTSHKKQFSQHLSGFDFSLPLVCSFIFLHLSVAFEVYIFFFCFVVCITK